MDTPKSPDALLVKTSPKKNRAPTLYAIIAVKVLKGIALFLLAFGVYTLRNKDLPYLFDSALRFVHLDPERQFFVGIGDWLETITPGNVKIIASGTFLYGVLLMVEGVGLAVRWRWAVWLVIGQSAFFVPVEIYQYVLHGSLAILALMVINIAIMWYLFQNRKRLFHTKH